MGVTEVPHPSRTEHCTAIYLLAFFPAVTAPAGEDPCGGPCSPLFCPLLCFVASSSSFTWHPVLTLAPDFMSAPLTCQGDISALSEARPAGTDASSLPMGTLALRLLRKVGVALRLAETVPGGALSSSGW